MYIDGCFEIMDLSITYWFQYRGTCLHLENDCRGRNPPEH